MEYLNVKYRARAENIDNFYITCVVYLSFAILNFIDRMIPLLPQEAHAHVTSSIPNKEFEVAYRLDCRNLCADFQEDIEFRFSLGISSLMYRFLGAKGTRQALMGYSDAVSNLKIHLGIGA